MFSHQLTPSLKLLPIPIFRPTPSLHRPFSRPLLRPGLRSFIKPHSSSSPLAGFRFSRLETSRTDRPDRCSSNGLILAIVPTTVLVLAKLFSGYTLQLDSGPARIRLASPETQEIDPAQLEQVESILSLQKLSFGTLTGICAGVFVRKGLGLVAFVCGGAFVFLQFLHSRALLTINWSHWAARYDRALARHRKPGAPSLPRRLIDFLTADFQYRATFVAGLLLGFRIA